MTTVALAIPGLDLRMRVHDERDRHLSRVLRETGLWEPFETELLRRLLKPGDRVLDVGANIGYFSLLSAACVGEEGKVYAFEPEPQNFALLEENITMNGYRGRVLSCQAALASEAGAGVLYISPDNWGDHQLYEEKPGRDSVPVALEAGAEWFSGRESRLDLVKVDVQGAEHAVIDGLFPLLSASGPGLKILLELTPGSLRVAGSSGRALVESLAALELPFHIVDHIEKRLVPSDAEALATWCDNLDAYPEDRGFMNIFLGQAL